jgi:endonuclease YncB( thermonuclease family)
MTKRSPSLAFAVAVLALLAGPAQALDACRLTPAGSAMVAHVGDGRTLALADGRELRLAAIEAPAESRAALQALAGTGPLRIETLGAARDRYGRVVGFAFAGEDRVSLQQALIAQGRALVAARAGGPACAEPLLAAERAARAAGRGLWDDPNFAPLRAENVTQIQSRAGRFALVEGRVLSVRESGATIYVNFGRRWTRSFSVIILRRLSRRFAAAGLDVKTLTGRRIRTRGVIERRSGPVIVAMHPEQIELIE